MQILYVGHVEGGFRNRQYDALWLAGLWSAQAKMESIDLKATWHWGSDSSDVNDPPGKPGHTPLNVGLPSAWGSADDDRMFSINFVRELLNWGLREMNE